MFRCQAVTVRFGGMTALCNLGVEFPTTGIVGLIGPNGAGKTTLLAALSGFVRVDEGEIWLGSKRVTDLPPIEIARLGVARSFQTDRMIGALSALENVLLAIDDPLETSLWCTFGPLPKQTVPNKRVRALEVLEEVGLGGVASKPARQLSFGQEKLLWLACCMATGAKVLLLDEPTAGVQSILLSSISNVLRKHAGQGGLTILVEHNIRFVHENTDVVFVMNQGRVVGGGATAGVLANPRFGNLLLLGH